MTNPFRTSVHDASLAKRAPYIYGILLKLDVAWILYIGQTLSRIGALGRLAQHLSDTTGATFRQRINALYNITEIDGLSVEFAAVQLHNQKSFWKDEPDYREAVESLVQYALLNEICDRKLQIQLVSRVQPNGYCGLGYIESEASRVVASLIGWIETRPTIA